jgi:hypothetical protein
MHANSPAQKAGLITFFDFILSANGVAFVWLPFRRSADSSQTSEQISFNEVVKQNVDKEMKLVVYNSKTDRTRGAFWSPLV